MKAVITGASSGIGRDMARILSKRGFDLILVARRKEKLDQLKAELKTNVQVISLDLSQEQACFTLVELLDGEEVSVLINNAGYGVFGAFATTDLESELNMIDLNIKAVHILTKLFLQRFQQADHGFILNVASSAAFLPGPLLSGYYASKAYVLRLTEAVYEELRREGSHVYIGALCPGPVETEFNMRANVKFNIKALKSAEVADYAIQQMFKRKLVIIPGKMMKATRALEKFVPEKMLLRTAYHLQKAKEI